MTAMTLSSRSAAPMRLLMFTDIHFGARSNSDQHLQDCLDYIDWFCALAKSEKATHIAFLGDWFENRNAINVRTLKYSQEAARRLDALGLPIFFIVGNHDLYHRSTRTIYSTDQYGDLKNFIIIAEPTELTKELYAAPFLFKDEYPQLADEINAHKYVIGHFEFRNFVVTGADKRLDHGPDAKQFTGPKYLMSGHFHKRQLDGNVIYIGNAFPTNYGDAGDSDRGAALLDTGTEDLSFFDYEESPLFYKTKLSMVLNGDTPWKPRSRVRCLLDMEITYSEVQTLREEMMEAFELREFSVEEDLLARQEAIATGIEFDDLDLSSLDVTVRQLLKEGVVATPSIDPDMLITLYEELQE